MKKPRNSMLMILTAFLGASFSMSTAMSAEQTGDKAKAAKYYSHLLKLDPGNQYMVPWLGSTLPWLAKPAAGGRSTDCTSRLSPSASVLPSAATTPAP